MFTVVIKYNGKRYEWRTDNARLNDKLVDACMSLKPTWTAFATEAELPKNYLEVWYALTMSGYSIASAMGVDL